MIGNLDSIARGRSIRLQAVIGLAFLLIVLLSGSGIVWLNNRATLDLLHRQVGHQFDILARGLSTHVAMQFGSAESVLNTLCMNPPPLSDPEHAASIMAHVLGELRQISPAVRALTTVTDSGLSIEAETGAAPDGGGPAYRLRIGRQNADREADTVIDLDANFTVVGRRTGSGSDLAAMSPGPVSEDAAPVFTSRHASMQRDRRGLTLSRRTHVGPGQVFGVSVQTDSLSTLLRQARVFDGEHISLFDAKGMLLADSSGLELPDNLGTMITATSGTPPASADALSLDQQAFAAFVADRKPRDGMFHLPDGEVYASVTSFDINGTTMIVASSVPTRLFEASASDLLFWSLMIEAAMLVVAGTMVAFASRSISRPIDILASDVERIINFEFPARTPTVSRIREIQRLLAATHMLELTLRAFSTYLPHHFVRDFLERGRAPALGGERAPVIVMFSDIDGFTGIAETMMPDDLMLQLSRYFAILEEEVLASGGTVDKFIGDGVMAFWPLGTDSAGAGTAVCRAVARAAERIDGLNRCFADEGRPTFVTRFGLHAGEALIGNVGTANRMNYTVLGHAVNVASRIEQLNKAHGSQILASATVRTLSDASIGFRPVATAPIRGSKAPIEIFEVMRSDALSNEIVAMEPRCDDEPSTGTSPGQGSAAQ